MATAGLTAYEVERLEKIERNQKRLNELDLKSLAASMLPSPSTPKDHPKVKTKKQRRSTETPPSSRTLRRSMRGQDYSPGQAAAAAAEEVAEEDVPESRGYNQVVGISCHFCRQKKLCKVEGCPRCSKLDDLADCSGKSICSVCKGPNGIFCEMCLRSRYGLTLEEARTESWVCPHCYEKDHPEEGWICNSSFCMQKRGLACTGIAIHEAKKLGFASVGHQIQAQIKGGMMRPRPLGMELPRSQGANSGKKRRRSGN